MYERAPRWREDGSECERKGGVSFWIFGENSLRYELRGRAGMGYLEASVA